MTLPMAYDRVPAAPTSDDEGDFSQLAHRRRGGNGGSDVWGSVQSGWSRLMGKMKNGFENARERSQSLTWVDARLYAIGILIRALETTLILVVVIAVLIRLRSASKPGRTLAETAEFDFKVNVSESKHAALWNEGFERGEYNVFMNMHSHSSRSDGSMSPGQLVRWGVAYGFNVLVVSDHNTITGGLEAMAYAKKQNASILVIPAVEYTCCRIHMNLIGINETIAPSKAYPSDKEMQRAIARTHELGGIAMVNHIPWSSDTEYGYNTSRIPGHPSKETLLEWGVDAFELVNADTLDLPTLRWAEKKGLPLVTGVDVHSPSDPARAWTVMKVKPPFTQRKILNRILKKNATSFIYDPAGPKERAYPKRNAAYDKWAPLDAVDFSFLYDESSGMYSFTGEFCHEHRFQSEFNCLHYYWLISKFDGRGDFGLYYGLYVRLRLKNLSEGVLCL